MTALSSILLLVCITCFYIVLSDINLKLHIVLCGVCSSDYARNALMSGVCCVY